MKSDLDHAINWKVTTNRYVVYLDIMGFKDMVARKKTAEIYSMMKQIIMSLLATRKHFGKIKADNSNERKYNLLTMTYSDSIIIYSEDSSLECQNNIISATSNLIDFMFEDGIPFRGAIAHGNMTVDVLNSIYFGQPLIDAYLLSEELLFYGIVCHASAEYQNKFKDNYALSKYPCQFKNGIAEHLTITPTSIVINKHDVYDFRTLKENVIKLGMNSSGSNRKYIDNTLTYLNTIKDNYD